MCQSELIVNYKKKLIDHKVALDHYLLCTKKGSAYSVNLQPIKWYYLKKNCLKNRLNLKETLFKNKSDTTSHLCVGFFKELQYYIHC